MFSPVYVHRCHKKRPRALPGNPDPLASRPETSGTGFFVHGLAWGVKRGLLERAEYGPAIERGWAALARAVARDGRLGWVQLVSDRPENVAESDTQFYGVGAVASLAEG